MRDENKKMSFTIVSAAAVSSSSSSSESSHSTSTTSTVTASSTSPTPGTVKTLSRDAGLAPKSVGDSSVSRSEDFGASGKSSAGLNSGSGSGTQASGKTAFNNLLIKGMLSW